MIYAPDNKHEHELDNINKCSMVH